MAGLNGLASKVKSEAKTRASTFLDLNKFNKESDANVANTIADRNENYDKMLRDSKMTAQQSTQIQDRRRNEDYARQQVNVDADRLERANVRASQPTSAGSYSESFGLGAAAPGGYSTGVFGQKSLYDASAVANWRQRQDGVLNDQYNQAKRMADIDKDNQAYLAGMNENIQARARQTQASIDSQREGNQRLFQSQEADKDRANQRYLAQMDASTRLQQAMFSGNGNGFQYWGGSI